MAGKRAGGFGSTYQFVLDGVTGYFRVVLHPRLQQDVASLLLIVSTLRHNSLAIDLLPVKLFNYAWDFPLEVVHSSITEIESMEKFRPNVFWRKGRKSRHQLQINREK
jgi:hypothetical protein